MQQAIGARQAALDIKLLLQDALRVDPAKRHHPIPRQVGAGNDPLLQTHRRRPIHKRLPARTRPVPQSLDPFFLITVMPLIGRGSAEPAKPPRFLRFHPLEEVGDHQNPLTHPPALLPG